MDYSRYNEDLDKTMQNPESREDWTEEEAKAVRKAWFFNQLSGLYDQNFRLTKALLELDDSQSTPEYNETTHEGVMKNLRENVKTIEKMKRDYTAFVEGK